MHGIENLFANFVSSIRALRPGPGGSERIMTVAAEDEGMEGERQMIAVEDGIRRWGACGGKTKAI